MECEQILLLLSGYIDRENTAEEERQLQTHLASCAKCRALLADLEAIDLGVAALSAEPPEALAAGVMAQLKTPARKRRLYFGGGTLAAAMIALAVILPSLSSPKNDAVPAPAALSAPAGEPAALAQDGPSSSPDGGAQQKRRTAAQFVTAAEPLLIEIADDPDLPAARNIAPLAQLPSALVDGSPEYYVDAAAAREIVDAAGHYTVLVPDALSGADDGAPCLVRIVAAK